MEYLNIKDIKIPRLGFGVWQLKGPSVGIAIKQALSEGIRHIDTAQVYDNEELVGKALKASPISRQEIFLTTKLWRDYLTGEDSVIKGAEASLKKLQTDYVDLLLIHWPFPEMPLEDCLKAMEKLKAEGKIRCIGVSNFSNTLLSEALKLCPQIVTNQVEYHPLLNQKILLQAAKKYGIFLTAYSSLARGHVMKIQQLQSIGRKHNKTPAQVSLRWLIEQDQVVALFKSAQPGRIKSNCNIFDFQLTPKENESIHRLTHNNKRTVNSAFAPQWDA